MKLVDVAVPVPLAGTLTYAVPAALAGWLQPGQRVRVRVGSRALIGVVWAESSASPGARAHRDLESLLDCRPVLTAELLELARFAADYYLTPLGEVVATLLPGELPAWGDRTVTLTPSGALASPRDDLDRCLRDHLLARGRQRLHELAVAIGDPALVERIESWIADGRLADHSQTGGGARYGTAWELVGGDIERLRERCGRSAAGRAVVDWLAALGRPATSDELRDEVGASAAVLRRLERLELVRRFRQVTRDALDRHLLAADPTAAVEHRLGTQQAAALEAIVRALEAGA
ncbi:MAG: hypothetical protein NDJ75_09750, partial [Thermoanaerobaculia bacterium]|nr:hypothetical protein [Thermoanaerobaculia bacterium]